MSRKIFVVTNLVLDNKHHVLSTCNNSILTKHAAGEFTKISPEELLSLPNSNPLPFADDYARDERERDVAHYFKRRAAARRAVATIKANGNGWGNLRIVELGTTERDVRPVKSWSVQWRISRDEGRTFGDWSNYSTGYPLRKTARDAVANYKSMDATNRTNGLLVGTAYEYKVVPVYAD